MTINAFHKDYVKTYMPEFLSTIRSESAAKSNGENFGSKSRATRESDGKSVKTITAFPKTKRVSIARTEFYIYSKAGMPNSKKAWTYCKTVQINFEKATLDYFAETTEQINNYKRNKVSDPSNNRFQLR